MVSRLNAGLRVAPLAAALALLHPHTACAAPKLDVPMPTVRTPGNHAGVAALFQALRANHLPTAPSTPVITPVTSCADDGSPGTLRSVIAGTAEGDTVDLSALTCSTITLTQGAIPIIPDVTLIGPGADKLALDGAGLDRVFVHFGYYAFTLRNLTVRNGFNQVSGYHVSGGACVLSDGYVTLDHSMVSGCTSVGEGAYGGAILAHSVALYSSTLSNNLAQGSFLNVATASYGGGAFSYNGVTVLYDSTVSNNRAIVDPGNTHGNYNTGAGIFTDNGGIAMRSTIAGNSTDGDGGGIASHAAFSISNSTISGNTAHRGGGAFARMYGAITVQSSTIAFNSAFSGGGIFFGGTSPVALDLQSTLIANNVASDLAATSPLSISGANNLVMSPGTGIVLPGDTLHADPQLLQLANNGGPTLTHALSLRSPARDAGNNAAYFDSDQRGAGYPRVIGAAADIGAYEAPALAQPPASVPAASTWVLALLATLIAGIGWRRRRDSA
jgi:hypothetical protein